MSWLSDRLGIHVNLRPLAPVAGGILGGMIGGPGGAALGAGLFKTADNKAHGDSWGHALGQGALNAGGAYLASGGLSQLRNLFGGSEAGASAAGSFTPGAGYDFTPGSAPSVGASPLTGGSGPAGSFVSGAATGGGGAGDSFLGGLGAGAKKVGSWAAEHPNAAAGALQGVGALAGAGAQNAQTKAQTRAIDLANQSNEYEMNAKKRRDAALAPLYKLFQGDVSNWQAHVNDPVASATGNHYGASPYRYS